MDVDDDGDFENMVREQNRTGTEHGNGDNAARGRRRGIGRRGGRNRGVIRDVAGGVWEWADVEDGWFTAKPEYRVPQNSRGRVDPTLIPDGADEMQCFDYVFDDAFFSHIQT